MSWYDYDYEAEPNYPEVEEIIDEASGKFEEFLRKAFANEYKNIEGARQQNQSKEARLNEREKSLDAKERELQEREAELAKDETQQYKKLQTKWFDELGLSFEIGDTVYYLKNVTPKITCPACNGTKKLNAKIECANGTEIEKEIDCPKCNGWGCIDDEKQYEIVEATVSEIDIRLAKRGGSIVKITNYMDETINCIWVRDKKNDEPHSKRSSDLYKTKEDCEKAVERLKGEKQ